MSDLMARARAEAQRRYPDIYGKEDTRTERRRFEDGVKWARVLFEARIPRYAMLDLWMALHGTSHPEFDEFYEEHGYAETWARLLAAVRAQLPDRETVARAIDPAIFPDINRLTGDPWKASLRAADAVLALLGGDNA